MSNGFYKNRRLKSFLFFAVCLLVSTVPHIYHFKNFLYLTFTISFLIACYGLNVISKNLKRSVNLNDSYQTISNETLPVLDILVAARDEENVIELSLIHI